MDKLVKSSLSKGEVPKHSLKSGIDFGWFERLGLTVPNLTEQLVLARNRLYYTAVKIASNSHGAAQDYDRRSLGRINAIMFPHNAPEVSNNILQNQLFVSQTEMPLYLFCFDWMNRIEAFLYRFGLT